MKLGTIKQEPKERVQKYFEYFNKFFQRGKIQDAKEKQRFLARLRPTIWKLCVVRAFMGIEKLVRIITELEKVLGELGETPHEPLKEEKGVSKTMMEKQVTILNNTLINFFKGNVPSLDTPSSSTMFGGCQIYKIGDHLTIDCPKLNKPWPKCAKCGMSHRIENCGIKCSFCQGLGHLEDRCWKKPKDGKSNSQTQFFLEVLLNDKEATMQQLNKLCGNENVFSYTRVPRRKMQVEVVLSGIVKTAEVTKKGIGINRDLSKV
jgi:hypothetical protein